MKLKYVLFCVFFCLLLLPSYASSSNWILFAAYQRNGLNWYYDAESLNASRELKIMGVTIPLGQGDTQKMWIKSSGDKVERIYQAELDCKARLARLQDDNGKTVYNDASFNYLYDRPIPPDSVLDMLLKKVCH